MSRPRDEAPVMRAPVAAPEPLAEARPCDIGFSEVAPEPPLEARRLNEAALERHRAGDFAASLEGFTSAIAMTPTFRKARFNRACALTRLDRLDEARAELTTLLCEDLPSFAPLVRADADLEAARADGELERTITSLAARYLDEAAHGSPLVAFGDADPGSFAQGGAWLSETHRFVPLTPKIIESRHGMWGNEGWGKVAPLYDLTQRRAIVLTSRGSDSEGAGPERSRARLFEVPTGREIASAPAPNVDSPFQRAALEDGHALLDALDVGVFRLDEAGLARASGPLTGPQTAPERAFLSPVRHPVTRGSLHVAEREFPLPREHRRGEHYVMVNEPGGFAIVHSWITADCIVPDRYAVDRVDLNDNTTQRLFAGRGQIIVDLDASGTLFVQTGEGTTRYPGAQLDHGEALPAGIGLGLRPFVYNPYC